jgi:PAS domain S-box-containing protein
LSRPADTVRGGRRLFLPLIAILVLGALGGIAASFVGGEHHFRAQVESELGAIATSKAGDLEHWRQARLADGSVFFRNPAWTALARRALEQPGDSAASRQIEDWFRGHLNSGQYDLICLLDRNGTSRISEPSGGESCAVLSEVGLPEARRTRQVTLFDLHHDSPGGTIHMGIIAPILEEGDAGRLLGFVLLRIDPNAFLYPALQTWPTPSRTAETLIVRREGDLVIYLNPIRFRQDAALNMRLPIARNELPAAQAARGREGLVEGIDYRGEAVMAAVRAVPDSPWFVVAKVDRSEIYGPLRARLLPPMLLAISLLLAAAAAAWALRTREVREGENRIRALADSARDAILVIDSEGRLTNWNPAAERILGYSRSEALGRNVHDLLVPARFRDTQEAAFPEFQRTGRGAAIGQTLELAARRKDGVEIAVELSLSAVALQGQWNAVGILRDITERKGAEAELLRVKEALEETNRDLEAAVARAQAMTRAAQQANAAKSQFLANVSHELRTPLNGVLGMADLLLDTSLEEDQRHCLEIVRTSGESLLRVINDILDFAKMEADKLDLESMAFDLRSTLDSVVDILAARALEKKLRFSCRLAPGIHSTLRGDPGRLRQVLLSLGENAVKFSERGQVALEMEVEKETDNSLRVRFEVHDNGIGVPPEMRERIFLPFEQADFSDTRRFGGAGLGLAIAKRVVELMGGEIGYRSRNGQGSTFWFTAVFSKEDPPEGTEERSSAELWGTRSLIVCDNAASGRLLHAQLAALGLRLEIAGDPSRALDLLREARAAGDPIRVVLCDLVLSWSLGEELGRAVQADPELRGTSLIALVSSGQRGDAQRYAEAGFAAYLVKPIQLHQLGACLTRILPGNGPSEPGRQPALITRHTLNESGRKTIRILVAEDNVVNQLVVQRMLAKLGLRADMVANGREAAQALESVPYDLVFMDVQMPEMDGLEATRVIRSGAGMEANAQVPIIALTAHTMPGDRERCFEAGMNDYLSKPLMLRNLADVLEKWLAIPLNT